MWLRGPRSKTRTASACGHERPFTSVSDQRRIPKTSAMIFVNDSACARARCRDLPSDCDRPRSIAAAAFDSDTTTRDTTGAPRAVSGRSRPPSRLMGPLDDGPTNESSSGSPKLGDPPPWSPHQAAPDARASTGPDASQAQTDSRHTGYTRARALHRSRSGGQLRQAP